MFFRSLEVDKLRNEMLPQLFLLLKRSFGWLEDLLINEHSATKGELFLPKPLRNQFSGSTTWLVWALGTAVADFESSMSH